MVLDVGLLLNGTAAHLNTPPHADTPGASTFRSSRSRAFNPATTTVTASTSTPALVLATQQPIVVEPMEEEAMPILMTSKRPRSPSFDRRDGGLGKAKYRSRGPAQSSPTEEEEDQVVPDSQLNQSTATIWPASQQRIGFSGDSSPPAEQQQVHENHVTQSRWPESEQAQRSPKEDDDDDDDERVGPHLDDSHDVETSFETDQDDFDANFSPSQYALPNPHSFMSDADAETAALMDVKADEHRYTPSQRPIEHDEDHSDVEGDSVAGDPHYHGAGAAHGLDDQTEREDDVVGAPAAPETVNKFTQMGFSEWLNAGDDLVARLGGIVTRFQEIQRTKQAGRQKLMDRIEAHKRALEAEDGRITNSPTSYTPTLRASSSLYPSLTWPLVHRRALSLASHHYKMGQSGSALLQEMEKSSNFSAAEIHRLRKRFMKLDRDGSGSIDRDEFLQIPAIANNPLASRMIAIFDDDGSGTVDFQEFVAGLSAFSSRGEREEKLKFAFKVYDMDRDGYISNGELYLVLKMMVGNNLKDQQLQQIVDKTIMEADQDGDGKLDFEEFKAMVANTDVARTLTLEDLF